MTAMKTSATILVALGAFLGAAGCANREDITKVAPGTSVELTRQDGGVIDGTLNRIDGQNAVLMVGSRERLVPINDVVSVHPLDRSANPTGTWRLPAAAKFREYVVPAGTTLGVRLETSVASDTSRPNERVDATLARSVDVDGVEALPAGTLLHGTVVEVQPSGRVQGRATLALEFSSIASNGDSVPIEARFSAEAPATKAKDAKTIGIPAAGGAVLGALLGGKKGALIGAGVGGGVGTAVVLSTSGQEIRWPAGTMLSVTLRQDANVRVPIARQ